MPLFFNSFTPFNCDTMRSLEGIFEELFVDDWVCLSNLQQFLEREEKKLATLGGLHREPMVHLIFGIIIGRFVTFY